MTHTVSNDDTHVDAVVGALHFKAYGHTGSGGGGWHHVAHIQASLDDTPRTNHNPSRLTAANCSPC